MANYLYAIVSIIVGIVAFVIAVRLIRNPLYLRSYVERSPKAYLWKKKYGVDKTMELTKHYFAPVGIVVSIILILVGIVFLVL
jgi:hypothetical protein